MQRAPSFSDFAKRVMQYRKQHPNFHRHAFYDDDPEAVHPDKNIVWFRADGKRMVARTGRLAAGCAPSVCI